MFIRRQVRAMAPTLITMQKTSLLGYTIIEAEVDIGLDTKHGFRYRRDP